jgi:hypothetical protein
VKILLMGLAIVVFITGVGMLLSVIFSAFELPHLGNIPAKIIGGIFTFYFTIVFSCILGYALYKNSAKLNLPGGQR